MYLTLLNYFLLCMFTKLYCQSQVSFGSKSFEYEFEVLNEEYPFNTSFSSSSNFNNILISKGLPIIKETFFKNENKSFDLLLNTGAYSSIIVNEICVECKWSSKKSELESNATSELVQSL